MKPKRYRKTATVQAMEWDPLNPRPVLDWLDAHGAVYRVFPDYKLGIGTLESGDADDGLDRHKAKPGDSILKGAVSEFYVCDRAVFQSTYKEVGWLARLLLRG